VFLEDISKKAAQVTMSYKKKTVTLNDLVEAVDMHAYLEFLKDAGVLRQPAQVTQEQENLPQTEAMDLEGKET
jgi:hypothetical protein